MGTRLGFYTGRLYDDSVDRSLIHECCLNLNYKEPVFDDEELVVKKRVELKKYCAGCMGCPEAHHDIISKMFD